MKLTETELARMDGTAVRDFLLEAVAAEREACGRLADQHADSLTRSGRTEHAMVAIELAAKIRARGAT